MAEDGTGHAGGSAPRLTSVNPQLTWKNDTVRPKIARVYDYRPRLWKLSQCEESARVSLRAAEGNEVRTRVLHSQELAKMSDVRFCLVFPRESLSIPVMRRVLGDTLVQARPGRGLHFRSAAGRHRGVHERAAARRSWAQVRGYRPRSARAGSCSRCSTTAAASIRHGSGRRAAGPPARPPVTPVGAARPPGQGQRDRAACRVGPRDGDHAGLRGRRQPAYRAGPRNRRQLCKRTASGARMPRSPTSATWVAGR